MFIKLLIHVPVGCQYWSIFEFISFNASILKYQSLCQNLTVALNYCNYFASKKFGDFNKSQSGSVFHKNPELPSQECIKYLVRLMDFQIRLHLWRKINETRFREVPFWEKKERRKGAILFEVCKLRQGTKAKKFSWECFHTSFSWVWSISDMMGMTLPSRHPYEYCPFIFMKWRVNLWLISNDPASDDIPEIFERLTGDGWRGNLLDEAVRIVF